LFHKQKLKIKLSEIKTKGEKLKIQKIKLKLQRANQPKLKNFDIPFRLISKFDLKPKPPKFLQYLVLLDIAKNTCASEKRMFLTKMELRNNENRISKNSSRHRELFLENQENTIRQTKRYFLQSYHFKSLIPKDEIWLPPKI
jgi:hypothetical protein